ncbi:hypothetical protein ASF29_12075 [Rhizobium sp. Leaf262]|nr:hypothetical protein ASF29_12075 [Rhizobium sp. Leaf262]
MLSDISCQSVFERLLSDGRIETGSNNVERNQASSHYQKNSFSTASDNDGKTWAAIATLLKTARMRTVEPQPWLKQTRFRLANQWPSSDIDAIMPRNYKI